MSEYNHSQAVAEMLAWAKKSRERFYKNSINFKPNRQERILERVRKRWNNSPYSLPDVRQADMLAHAIEAIRTKYSKSSNPEQFKYLKVLHSPNTKEAIITFFKVRALFGHKQHWIPTLGLHSMSTQDRVNLCEELFKIQHPSDKESIANNPLPAALSGERSRISPRLVAQLIAANYEDLERHNRKLVLEPSMSGAERYRWSSTCKGLWYKINNQHLYESIRLLEERHPEVFFLIRYRLFSER